MALKIQDYIPRATRPGMINNWDQSFPADTIKSISTIKVDHNFTGNGKLSGYYSRYWGPHYNGSDGLPIPITKVRQFETSTHTMRVTYDWVLSPTTLLNSRVGFVRHWNPDFGLPEVREFDPVAGLGLRGRRERHRVSCHRRHVHADRRRHVGRHRGCRQPAGDEEAAGARQHHPFAQYAHLQSRVRVA